jgi:hypothetical protein
MYISTGTLRNLIEMAQVVTDNTIAEETLKTKVDSKKVKLPFDGKVVNGITRLEFIERVFTRTPNGKGGFNDTFVDKCHEDRMYFTKEGLWKHFMQDYLDTSRLPSGGHAGRYRIVRVNGVCYAPGSTQDKTYWKHLAESILGGKSMVSEEIVIVQGIIPEGGKNERFDISTDEGLIGAFKKLIFIDDTMTFRGMKMAPEGMPWSEWSKKPHMKKSRDNEKIFGKVYALLLKRNLKFTYSDPHGKTHQFPPNASIANYRKEEVENLTEAGMGDAYMRQVAERNYRKALDAYNHYADAGLQNPKRLREIEMELDRATEQCEKMGLKCGKGIK